MKTEKVFEAIDLIEIGIWNHLDDDCIYKELISILRPYISSTLLFKILTFYEWVNLIETLLKEIYPVEANDLLSQTLEYSIEIDRMKVAFYMIRRYSTLVFKNKQALVHQLVECLKLYNDVDIREKGCGIMHLEEKLYIIEILLPYINLWNALDYGKAISILLNYDDEGEEVSPFGKFREEHNPFKEKEIEKDPGVIVAKQFVKHHTKDNFLIHNSNSLKIAMILLVHCKQLYNRHPVLGKIVLKPMAKLESIIIEIFDTIKCPFIAWDMLEDFLYNGA